MKKRLIFATGNVHKLNEVRNIKGLNFEISGLKDIGFAGEIPEDFDTLQENALQKARFIHDQYGTDCFADDTGLEIDALNGRPGVLSARYAGAECDPEKNIRKILRELEGVANRSARFRTVIALILENKIHFFEGVVEGEILKEKHGEDGFGYDPVFRPSGYSQTFAEMPLEEKNRISHRAQAMQKLIDFLKHYSG